MLLQFSGVPAILLENYPGKYHLPICDFRGPPYAPCHPSHEPTKVLQVFSVTAIEYLNIWSFLIVGKSRVRVPCHDRAAKVPEYWYCCDCDEEELGDGVHSAQPEVNQHCTYLGIFLFLKDDFFCFHSHFTAFQSPKKQGTSPKMEEIRDGTRRTQICFFKIKIVH